MWLVPDYFLTSLPNPIYNAPRFLLIQTEKDSLSNRKWELTFTKIVFWNKYFSFFFYIYLFVLDLWVYRLFVWLDHILRVRKQKSMCLWNACRRLCICKQAHMCIWLHSHRDCSDNTERRVDETALCCYFKLAFRVEG